MIFPEVSLSLRNSKAEYAKQIFFIFLLSFIPLSYIPIDFRFLEETTGIIKKMSHGYMYSVRLYFRKNPGIQLTITWFFFSNRKVLLSSFPILFLVLLYCYALFLYQFLKVDRILLYTSHTDDLEMKNELFSQADLNHNFLLVKSPLSISDVRIRFCAPGCPESLPGF